VSNAELATSTSAAMAIHARANERKSPIGGLARSNASNPAAATTKKIGAIAR
jgi:hypothetical protein